MKKSIKENNKKQVVFAKQCDTEGKIHGTIEQTKRRWWFNWRKLPRIFIKKKFIPAQRIWDGRIYILFMHILAVC